MEQERDDLAYVVAAVQRHHHAPPSRVLSPVHPHPIIHPGQDYSLQSIPSLSSVADYDVRRNQPDFFRMLENRIEQAIHASRAKEQYRKAFGYTEVDIARLDPDVYSDSVMDLINEMIANSWVDVTELPNMDEGTGWMQMPSFMEYEENMEQQQAILAAE